MKPKLIIPRVAVGDGQAFLDQKLMQIVADNFDELMSKGLHPVSALTILLNVQNNIIARCEPESERHQLIKFLRSHLNGRDIEKRRAMIAAEEAAEKQQAEKGTMQ